jgi:hypothetical protein
MGGSLSPDSVQQGNGSDERHSLSQTRGHTHTACSIAPRDIGGEL